MKTTCVVAEAVNKVVVGEYTIRDPQADEIMVKTLYSTISTGTELRSLAGKEPNAPKFPMITGYSLVGQVIKGNKDIKEGQYAFMNGTQVPPEGIASTWGGHVAHAICRACDTHVLPENINLKWASAMSMFTIALHGACRANPKPADNVLITGQGLIGQLATAILNTNHGCSVAVCDSFPARLEIARKMGVHKTYLADKSWPEEVRKDFPKGFDVIVDTTGVPEVLESNLPLLRDKPQPYDPSPKVVILGSYPGKISFDYQITLFAKEADIITSRVYLPHELEMAKKLMTGGRINLDPILGDELPVRRADEAFRRLREERDRCLTFVLNWSEVQ
jgi:bacteriochlorophyllide a dehydrogenase